MRTKEALTPRKVEGVILGRKKDSYTKINLLAENRRIIIGMLKRDCSIIDICKRFDTSRDTFAKFRSRNKDVSKALDEKEKRRKEKAQYRKSR